MKKRWLVNLIMLLVVVGLATFLYLRPQSNNSAPTQHEVSTLKLADFTGIDVVFPTQKPTSFVKIDGLWHMTSPYKSRADQVLVQRILAIIAAKSVEKLSASDLAKYGLDNPQLRLKLNKPAGAESAVEEFIFGTFNPITEEQYVAYKDAVYLLPGSYSEAASTQAIELIDKNPLSRKEAKLISGFNFSHLEQWQEIGLNVDIVDGKWKVNAPKAKITQNELNEWLDFNWKQAPAKQVELYSPDSKTVYPSFEVKFKDGSKIRFDKIQESPELLIGRPDEGILYHFNNDVGFTMLNPPLHIQ
jgi:Domain of unknown function (DUF4340)